MRKNISQNYAGWTIALVNVLIFSINNFYGRIMDVLNILMKQRMQNKSSLKLFLFSILIISGHLVNSQTTRIEAESGIAWVESFGSYTNSWSVSTDAGLSGGAGRKPGGSVSGCTGTSLRGRYATVASMGLADGNYDITLGFFDRSTNTGAAEIHIFIGPEAAGATLPEPPSDPGGMDVYNTFSYASGTIGPFTSATFSNITLTQTDAVFVVLCPASSADNGVWDYIDFTPSFPNVNPPVINNQSFNVDENSSNGTVVGTVVASDPDAGQSIVTYNITAGNTGGVFTIDNSGVIRVNGPLDFETNPTYNLTVEACDNGTPVFCSSATVTIDINDVFEAPNDFDPVITNAGIARSIAENSNGGTAVGAALTSTDGDGNSVTYSITGGNVGNAFYINSTTGQIYVNGLLDFETLSSYSLSITATDNGVPSRSSTSTVIINVTNQAESSPSLTAWYGTCSGTTVPIVANPVGAVFAGWEISGGGITGITSPSSASTTVTNHLTSVTYIARAVVPSGGNLITNGGFESGTAGCPSCTGFTSSYSYDSSPDGPGDYCITTDAGSSSGYLFSSPAQEGSWYLAADGSSTSGEVVYQTTVSVVSGQSYSFSGWFANGHEDGAANIGEAAHMEFRVNGTYTGDIQLPVDAGGVWYNYTSAYTATSTGTITIQIVNRNTAGTRNDFFIDNLNFQQATLLTQSITVPLCPDPLPVKLISFTGNRLNNVNVLSWSTAYETNNSFFLIQRSANGMDFTVIGGIEGSGNSDTEIQYSYEDLASSEQTVYYYRLIQVDVDGTASVSPVILIQTDEKKELQVYPNPNTGSFVIDILPGDNYRLDITELGGKLIFEQKGQSLEGKIEISGLASGMYIIRLYTESGVLNEKMIVY